jgi:hypothetical protein
MGDQLLGFSLLPPRPLLPSVFSLNGLEGASISLCLQGGCIFEGERS